MLRMEHISKRFGSFYANKDITLTVNRGEVLTLLGENGAGKSTLMNILIGLYQPTEGKIFLEGKEVRIESPSQAVKLGIGMVHQHFMLVEAMTVFDNIILGDKHAKGLFIARWGYPTIAMANNNANYMAALAAMGGTENNKVLPVWWSGQAVARDAGTPWEHSFRKLIYGDK